MKLNAMKIIEDEFVSVVIQEKETLIFKKYLFFIIIFLCINSKYKKVNKFFGKICEKCPKIINMIFFHLGIILICLLSIFIVILLIIKSYNNYKIYMIKVSINFIHILILMDNYNISISKKLQNFISILQKITEISNFWLSLECIIAENFQKKINFYHFQYIYQISFLISIVLLLNLFAKHFKLEINFKTIIIILIFLLQSIMINQSLSTLTCLEIEGNYFYKKDLESFCYDKQYFLWGIFLYFPILFLFTFFIPYFIFKNYSKKKKIYENKYLDSLFFKGYKEKKRLWEIFNIIFKLILVVFKNSTLVDEKKIISELLLLFYFVFFQIYFDPYSDFKLFNYLDISTKIFVICNLYFLIWIELKQETNLEIIFFTILIIFLIIIIIVIIFGTLRQEKKKKSSKMNIKEKNMSEKE